MGKYDDKPYSVGKGKPPKEHQFKPCQSGNPHGPRQKRKAIEATINVLMSEAVNELIPVVINGRDRRIPKKQAIVLGVVNDALQGTATQRLKAMKALHEMGAFEPKVIDDRRTPEEREAEVYAAVLELAEFAKKERPDYTY